MTKVVALQTWSNGTITMDEKSVLDIDDALATDLIAKGIVADAADYFSGSGGSLPPITASDNGKVLTANNSGVWVASDLPTMRNVDNMIFLSASYVNGQYVCNTSFDTNEFAKMFADGRGVWLTLNRDGTIYNVYPILVSGLGDSLYYIGSYTDDGGLKHTLSIMFIVTGETVTIVIYDYDDRFIVTLTPTALDYSGTMDKTVAEIDAAYKAGRKIVFRLYTAAGVCIDVPVQLVSTDTDYEYPSFETSVMQSSANALILAKTGTTNDGTKVTYSTNIYTLTPAT